MNRQKNTFHIAADIMFCLLILLMVAAVAVNGQTSSFPDCKSGPLSTFPICDRSLPPHQRTADLVSRMTIAEKITQMITSASAIPRLGLSAYQRS